MFAHFFCTSKYTRDAHVFIFLIIFVTKFIYLNDIISIQIREVQQARDWTLWKLGAKIKSVHHFWYVTYQITWFLAAKIACFVDLYASKVDVHLVNTYCVGIPIFRWIFKPIGLVKDMEMAYLLYWCRCQHKSTQSEWILSNLWA